MQFTSPTINMWSSNEDYIRFVGNLEYYMQEPMKEVEQPLDFQGMLQGRINDVVWNFNHDAYYSTAEARWKRGVERFNWDNYIAMMVIEGDDMAYAFEALPVKHKIGFYYKELHLKSVVYLPEWQNSDLRFARFFSFNQLVLRMIDEKGSSLPRINWMKLLLHEEDYIRA